ncbi:hypothetical protein [Piscirickettsia salmonis]|uniref:hypothetical protein n=1 Tax=Piscirickettsia salmonis TaxID=1238 RepID=UPI0007C9737E|nr:hypothetical protein A0O36_01149 [Piscirickettsiaceae bacterium NZ-RLO1]
MFKKIVSSFKSAASYSFLKESFSFIFSTSKKIMTVSPDTKNGEKIQITELEISSYEIKKAKSVFRFLMWIYFIFFIIIFTYTLVNIVNHSLMTAIIGIAASLACLSLAFKYHFWLTQIKVGQLGITLKEWYDSLWK